MKTAWLLRDGEVVCALEIANTVYDRSKGLLGRTSYEGAMYLPHVRSVHTLMMRFPIDVAFIDKKLEVVGVQRLAKWRIALPRRRTHSIIEAEAGSFERWGLAVGDRLEIREIS